MGDKSKAFAIRIVGLYQYLQQEKGEYTLSKQVLRAGTSIGANIIEADYACSHRDFISKLSISLKENAETLYWLDLLYQTGYLTQVQYSSISKDAEELIRLLTSAIKTARAKR